MIGISDIFDEVVCMCYDKRHKEWDEIDKFFKKRNVKFRKIIGGDGKILPEKDYYHLDTDPPIGYNLNRQGWNYYRTVKKIIFELRKKKVKNILFLEDDVKFSNQFDKIFDKAFSQIHEWDMVYFGYSIAKNLRVLQIHDNVVAFNGRACGMHCVGINQSLFTRILTLDENGYIDGNIGEKFHNKLKCFGIYPQIATQKVGRSYHANKIMDKSDKLVTPKEKLVDCRKLFTNMKKESTNNITPASYMQ